MVTEKRSIGLPALLVLAAVLCVPMALVRGGAFSPGSGERAVADLLGAQVLAPGFDEAGAGSGRLTITQGRRLGPAATSAVVPGWRLTALLLAWFVLPLIASRPGPGARPGCPTLRGPPAG